MTHLARLNRAAAPAEVTRPDPDKVISGDPVHTTWNLETRDTGTAGTLYCGLWQSTPGTWRIAYEEWEYIHILSGHSVLTDAAGHKTTLKTGDSYVIRPGFSGTWTVIETTLKDYVILT